MTHLQIKKVNKFRVLSNVSFDISVIANSNRFHLRTSSKKAKVFNDFSKSNRLLSGPSQSRLEVLEFV